MKPFYFRNYLGTELLIILLLLSLSYLAYAEVRVEPAPDYAPVIEKLTDFIEEKMDDEEIPGLSIALVNDKKILWAQGFGYADKEDKRKASKDTLYRVGSLSTVFTAVAILQLAEQGKLSLDAPVVRYLPEFSLNAPEERARQITIRHLLTHHAGLPLSIFKGMWTENPDSLAELMPEIAQLRPSFDVDEVYAYSNLGYDILGRLIEARSGTSYTDYMQHHVIGPLGLHVTNYSQSVFISQDFSKGYKKEELKDFLPARDLPALGLNSSVSDLAHFVQFMMKQQDKSDVLSVDARQQMFEAQNRHVALDLNKGIGFGWQIGGMKVAPEEVVVWKQGSTLLHRSRIAFLPKHQLGVVVLSNSSKAFRVVEEVAEKSLRLMLEAKAGLLDDAKDAELGAPPGETSTFANAYATYLGLLQPRYKRGEYKLDLMGWGFELIPRGEGWFRLEYDLFGFIPINLDLIAEVSIAPVKLEGCELVVVKHNGINYLFGERIDPFAISPAWRSRQGTYAPVTLDALLEHYNVTQGQLKEQDGFLVFEYKLPYWVPLQFRLPIKPISENEALIPGLGTGLNTYVQVKKANNKEYLHYSGYDLQKEK